MSPPDAPAQETAPAHVGSERRPSASRWRSDRFTRALFLVTVLGLVWRIAYAVWMRNRPVISDGFHYHQAALNLVDGLGFTNPLIRELLGASVQDAVHPPAWTLVLAGPSALGLRSLLSHQIVACLIGGATIVMSGLAGRAAFGRRAGIVAAILVAVYPNVWIYERELFSEPLAFLGVATTIWLAYRFHATPGTAGAIALGAMVGLLAMTRAEMLAVSVFLVAPLVLSASTVTWRRRIGWLAMAAGACLLVIAPWAVYNSTRFERPVPLSTNSGAALLVGNCGPTYRGELLGHYAFGCITYVRNVSGDPSVADGQFRDAALDFMRNRASRVPVVMAARVGRTFGFFRPFQQIHFEGERGSELWVIRLSFFTYWALLPLAVAGAVVARRRSIPIYPLLAFPAIVLLSVLFTVGSVRYRAPSDLSVILLAALAIETAVEAWRRRRDSAKPVEDAAT